MLFSQKIRYRTCALVPPALKRRYLRRQLRTQEFAIVSNNCWGAHIYRAAGLPYLTPFVGLAMTPAAYLDLLSNWECILGGKISFLTESSDASIEKIRRERNQFWPVGLLAGKVEIQFMHESTPEAARMKWERRLHRMPRCKDRIFVKFDDVDLVTPEQTKVFDELHFPHKVFFTSNGNTAASMSCAVHIPSKDGRLPDGWTLSKITPQYFDSAAWICGHKHPGKPYLSFV